jgi:hypothetical protein
MADEPAPKEPAKPAEPAPVDIKALVADAVKQHGDMNTAYHALLRERDTIRDELAATKGKLPRADAVVLDAAQAKLMAAWQAIGEPDDVVKRLDAGTKAVEERDKLKFDAHMGEVSTLAKMRPAVLADRVKASGVEILIQEVADPKAPTGAKIRVPHVKGEGDKTTPLADYATEHWADSLPALSVEPAAPAAPRGSPSTTGNGPPRPPVVERTGRPLQSLVR